MANRTITFLRVCKTDDGWQRLPIVMGKNGRIRPGYALVDGEPVAFPDGHYVLRSYEGKRTIFRNVSERMLLTPWSHGNGNRNWQTSVPLLKVMGVAFDDPDPCMSRCTRCLPTRMP